MTAVSGGLNARGSCTGCSCTRLPHFTTPLLASAVRASQCTAPPAPTVSNSWVVKGNSDVAVNTCTTGGATAIAGNYPSGHVSVDPMIANSSCSPTGTPGKPALSWAESTRFCETANVGGGCTPGHV